MSVHIVDHEHIRVLVWAGLRPSAAGPLQWAFLERDEDWDEDEDGLDAGEARGRELTPDTAAAVGAMLVAQNERVVGERYAEEPGEEAWHRDYVHAAPVHDTWSAVELIKAIEYYRYQSFTDEEYDDAGASESLQFLNRLIMRVVDTLPGRREPGWSYPAVEQSPEMQAAPWGIHADTVPAAG
jgi:hypothetical protein